MESKVLKKYEKPILKVHGDIKNVTRGGGGESADYPPGTEPPGSLGG